MGIALLRTCGYPIGKDVYIAEDLIIVDPLRHSGNLIIGDRVSLGPMVTLLTAYDPVYSKIRPSFKIKRAKNIIQNDSFIGTGVIILPDITIGECAVVGAGAVVTKDVPPYTVVTGVPANIIRKLGPRK